MSNSGKKYHVYRFTNKSNGKVYVGKTDNVRKRFNVHKKAQGDCPLFHNAVAKYGIEGFDFTILGTYNSEQEALEAEIRFISDHNSNKREFGYNLTNGGDGVSGYKHSPETIAQFSQSLKGRLAPNKGKKASTETVERLSISHMGHPGFWEGKKLSEETRKKKSNAMKGKTWKMIDGKRVWFNKADKDE